MSPPPPPPPTHPIGANSNLPDNNLHISTLAERAPNYHTSNPDDTFLWMVKVAGFDVDSSFGSHIESVTESRGAVLGKTSRLGIREEAATWVAVLGPRDLFRDVESNMETRRDGVRAEELYVISRDELDRLSTPKCPVRRVQATLLKDEVDNDPGWTSIITKKRGTWRPIHSVDWQLYLQQYLFYAIVLVIFIVPMAITTAYQLVRYVLGVVGVASRRKLGWPFSSTEE